jgi:pyoverdine/dityrosine biosynthesis protein Dit1
MAFKIMEPGTRVLISSEKPRYDGRTGVITNVNITYTVALDEMLDDIEAPPVLEVRARPSQLRVA